MFKQLFKDTAIYGIGDFASRIVAVLLIPFYTRLLDVADFGRLDLLVVLSVALGTISGMQLGSGVGRSYFDAKEAGRHRQLAGTGLILRLFSTTTFILIFAVVYDLFLQGRHGICWAHVVPLLALLHPAQLFAYMLYLLRLDRRPRSYGLIILGDVVCRTLMSLAAITVFDGGVPGILWAFVVSKGVWSLVALWSVRSLIQIRFDRTFVREILSFSLPNVPAVLSTWLQRHGSRFLILGWMTMADVGVFSMTMKIATIAVVFDIAFRTAWWPIGTEMMGKPGASVRFARVLEFYIVAMLGVYAMASCLAFLAIKVLATDDYLTAGLFVAPIVMGHLWDGVLLLGATGLKVVRRTHWIAFVLIAGAVLNLSLLAATVGRWGLPAVGITYLTSNIAGALLMIAVSQRHHALPYRRHVFFVTFMASLLLPLLLSLFPMPTGGFLEFVVDASLRLSVALVLWIATARFVLRQEDRAKLWQRLRWSPRKVATP